MNAFATGLDHPRWLFVLPNGDVLVAETAAPPQPEATRGLMGWAMKMGMRWAGADVPSANRITLLRDADGDGVAETRSAFLTGLNSPVGMALVGNDFYVANTDWVMRFPYTDGATEITAEGEKIADLPAGPVNLHWVKNIVASPDGAHLYASVGSNSNLGERGMENEEGRAAIHEIDLATGKSRLFATGLRNPVGLAFHPDSGALWTTVNERDELGSDLVPDYMTTVQESGFYGWPYSYYGDHLDPRARAAAARPRRQGHRARLCARAPHRIARACLLRRHAFAGALSRRRLCRPARLVEPQAPKRLQGDLRAVRGRSPRGQAGRHSHRLPERGRRRLWPARRAWPSTKPALYSSPTTWAIPSGASHQPLPDSHKSLIYSAVLRAHFAEYRGVRRIMTAARLGGQRGPS